MVISGKGMNAPRLTGGTNSRITPCFPQGRRVFDALGLESDAKTNSRLQTNLDSRFRGNDALKKGRGSRAKMKAHQGRCVDTKPHRSGRPRELWHPQSRLFLTKLDYMVDYRRSGGQCLHSKSDFDIVHIRIPVHQHHLFACGRKWHS